MRRDGTVEKHTIQSCDEVPHLVHGHGFAQIRRGEMGAPDVQEGLEVLDGQRWWCVEECCCAGGMLLVGGSWLWLEVCFVQPGGVVADEAHGFVCAVEVEGENGERRITNYRVVVVIVGISGVQCVGETTTAWSWLCIIRMTTSIFDCSVRAVLTCSVEFRRADVAVAWRGFFF